MECNLVQLIEVETIRMIKLPARWEYFNIFNTFNLLKRLTQNQLNRVMILDVRILGYSTEIFSIIFLIKCQFFYRKNYYLTYT